MEAGRNRTAGPKHESPLEQAQDVLVAWGLGCTMTAMGPCMVVAQDTVFKGRA